MGVLWPTDIGRRTMHNQVPSGYVENDYNNTLRLSDSIIDDEFYFLKHDDSSGSLILSTELPPCEEFNDWCIVQANAQETREDSESTPTARTLKVIDTSSSPKSWWEYIASPFRGSSPQSEPSTTIEDLDPEKEALKNRIKDMEARINLLQLKWDHVTSRLTTPTTDCIYTITAPSAGASGFPVGEQQSRPPQNYTQNTVLPPVSSNFTPAVPVPSSELCGSPQPACDSPAPCVNSAGAPPEAVVPQENIASDKAETGNCIPSVVPPEPPRPETPPPPPIIGNIFKQGRKKKEVKLSKDEVHGKLKELIQASDISTANHKLAFDNFLKVFSFRNSVKVLNKLLTEYHFLVKQYPLDPSHCFKVMLHWEKELFSKLSKKDQEYYRKKKWYQIANQTEPEQIDQLIQQIREDLILRKKKEEEAKKLALVGNQQKSLIDELKKRNDSKLKEEVAAQGEQELDLLNASGIDLTQSELLASFCD